MPCVLIVEDDPDLRELMEFILAEHGYETISAWNGLQALEKMAARRPDVVLLDIHMPVMDGVEFRRQQLEDPQRRDVPVIAVTAHHNPRDVEGRLGVKCLSKPLSLDQLLMDVHHACTEIRNRAAQVHGQSADLTGPQMRKAPNDEA